MKSNRIFTQISLEEIRQIFREELRDFFKKNMTSSQVFKLINPGVLYSDDTTIEELDISVRLYNGLKIRKIETVGQLKCIDEKTFLSLRGLGKSSWREAKFIVDRSTTSIKTND